MPVAIAEAFAVANPNGHFIAVSAIGADKSSRIFYSQVKGEMEAAVAALPLKQKTFVRPGLLKGERQESRPGERLAILLSPIFDRTLVGPLAKYKSVHAVDVAQAMARLGLKEGAGVDVVYG